MGFAIRLDEDFLNATLEKLKPKPWMLSTVSIRESVILLTTGLRKWGITIRFTISVRVVDFQWTDTAQTVTLELVKASILDPAQALSLLRPYLPDWVSVNAPRVLLSLHEADALKPVFNHPILKQMEMKSIRQETGWLEVDWNWKEDPDQRSLMV